jgi:uncharacterized membrane protein YfcA
MTFLISGQHLNPYYLVSVGFIIGVLGGFFGVGGSFLAGPALLAVGIPANFVVGTDLAHIVGKSVVAAKKHYTLGNVDFKLGGLMVLGTVVGVEIGAQFIEHLKRVGDVNQVVSYSYLFVLIAISAFMAWESIATLRMQRRNGTARASDEAAGNAPRQDDNAFGGIARMVQGIRLPPFVDLPTSGIRQISLWAILGVGLIGGIVSGFLGAGGGYIRMPAMVYLLGAPTHIAVGTDLLEIIVSASYGTISHAIKGNVDILIALVMNTGAAIGAQIGAIGTQHFGGPKIRLAFSPLPLIGAGLLIYNLVSGRHL